MSVADRLRRAMMTAAETMTVAMTTTPTSANDVTVTSVRSAAQQPISDEQRTVKSRPDGAIQIRSLAQVDARNTATPHATQQSGNQLHVHHRPVIIVGSFAKR